jgi:hypothetical protein
VLTLLSGEPAQYLGGHSWPVDDFLSRHNKFRCLPPAKGCHYILGFPKP